SVRVDLSWNIKIGDQTQKDRQDNGHGQGDRPFQNPRDHGWSTRVSLEKSTSNVGIKTRVRSVPKPNPPMMVQAMATDSADPSPVASAIGIRPRMVVAVVMTIGRKRLRP